MFAYSIYFIDDLSISAYKKFMIFSINHFSIEAHRIKWTRHSEIRYFFHNLYPFLSSLQQFVRMKRFFFFWCNDRSFAFYYFKYARYQHQINDAALVKLKINSINGSQRGRKKKALDRHFNLSQFTSNRFSFILDGDWNE